MSTKVYYLHASGCRELHHVHKSVLESNEIYTGCTIHIVSEKYDKGPILAQKKIAVNKYESAEQLAKRVLKVEHQLYPKIIASYLKQLNSLS